MAKYLEKAQLERLWGKIKAYVEANADGSGACDYSYSEQKTGAKWIDGKDIYCKTVDVDLFPSSTSETTTSYAHNITGIGEVVDYELRWFDTTDNRYYVNDFFNSYSYFLKANGVTPTHVFIRSRGYNYNARTNKRKLTVWYTKDEKLVLSSVFAGSNNDSIGSLSIRNNNGYNTNTWLDITAVNTTTINLSTSIEISKADNSGFETGRYRLTVEIFDPSKDSFYYSMSGNQIGLINSINSMTVCNGTWTSDNKIHVFEFDISQSNIKKLRVMKGGFYLSITSYINGDVGKIYIEKL